MNRSLGVVVVFLSLALLVGPTAFLVWAHHMFTVGVSPLGWLYVEGVAVAGGSGLVVGLGLVFRNPRSARTGR